MRTRSLSLFAAAAAAAVGLAACGGGSSPAASSGSGGSGNTASAPGVTATSVTIGSHQPLTGVAAPGYSEIAPASKAYFEYVNANGGVYGRSINYVYDDDMYNPAQTVSVVHKLVLQQHVFGIFNGLGTPTHQQVVDFLNQEKVPDLFVASGCLCWNEPAQHPETFGWQPDYTIEGKVLGQYLAQNDAGKKIAVFAQGDDFGHNGVQGLQDELPSSDIATIQYYDPTNTNIASQAQKLQESGADIVVSFTVPAFTALLQLADLQLKYSPQLVVSNVGSDPRTLSGLLTSFSKGAAPGQQLVQGIITDSYLPSPTDTSNSWVKLFTKVLNTYDKGAPLDGNTEYGMAAAYTFVQALHAAGQNPTRASIVSAIQSSHFQGPGLTPFAYSSSSHAGYTGVEVGRIKGLGITALGKPMVTDDTSSGAVTPTDQQPVTAPASGIPSD